MRAELVSSRPRFTELSGFERRCLLRHIGECRELLELTIVGAMNACMRCTGSGELARLREALEAAEALVESAETIAAACQADGKSD
jgi:hypothetical protein